MYLPHVRAYHTISDVHPYMSCCYVEKSDGAEAWEMDEQLRSMALDRKVCYAVYASLLYRMRACCAWHRTCTRLHTCQPCIVSFPIVSVPFHQGVRAADAVRDTMTQHAHAFFTCHLTRYVRAHRHPFVYCLQLEAEESFAQYLEDHPDARAICADFVRHLYVILNNIDRLASPG